MTTYSKLNVVYRLQKWMDSVPGQTFLNYAYSWGASIVILGTLFKLTHLSGADFFLFLGMGTEVFVFFISAFDRPFDKTTDGMELDIHANATPTVVGNVGGVVGGGVVGEVVPAEGAEIPEGVEIPEGGVINVGGPVVAGGPIVSGGPIVAGGATAGGSGTVIIGGGSGASVPVEDNIPTVEGGASSGGGTIIIGGGNAPAGGEGPVVFGGGGGAPVVTPSAPNPELDAATAGYVDELKHLTETLAKVSAQNEKLAHDSEEMENLNRTLTGICKVYEMQLKSASSQIGTIDDINEQTKKMAEQIAELNKIYARMIEAMTAKMNV